MARSQTSPLSNMPNATSLGLSSFHERHRILEEEHQWLLKQIKRKRSELKNFLDQMSSIATQIIQQATPVYEQLIALDKEIHQLFEEILTKRKLGKKSKLEIRHLYRSLQLFGLLSPRFNENEEVKKDSSLNDPNDEPESNFSNQHKSADQSYQEHFDNSFNQTLESSPPSREIRQTFLKLASMFHPDKVAEGETQSQYTEIMKEVNRAYAEGDVARLLEIERQHNLQQKIDLTQTSKSQIERLCIQREKDNQLLLVQYENLKKELRTARNTPQGEIVKDYRACQKQGIDAVAEMILELESQVKHIESICNFVRDFRDRKITIKEFLQGPVDTSVAKEDEEILEMMLDKILEIKF